MVMAFITWLLMKFGVAPDADDFRRMDRDFRERGHHLTIDFGKQHFGWETRWEDPDWMALAVVGLGYEYLVDRRYHALGLEALAESHGPIFKPETGPNRFFVGGGLAYYPIRNLRLFTQGGAQIDMHGGTSPVGRVGIGYRFMFFKLGMQPFFYLEQVGSQPGWAMNFRFEY